MATKVGWVAEPSAGGSNGMSSSGMSRSERGPRPLGASSAGTVITGRLCHSLSAGLLEPAPARRASTPVAGRAIRGHAGIARVELAVVDAGPVVAQARGKRVSGDLAVCSTAWAPCPRITRTLGDQVRVGRAALDAERRTSRRQRSRVLGAEGAVAEAWHAQARLARSRRAAAGTATPSTSAEPVSKRALTPRHSGHGWRWVVGLASLALLLMAGLSLAKLHARARSAVTQAAEGLRSIEPALAGTVAQVLVQVGSDVAAGQVVAQLDDTLLADTVALRERELAALSEATARATREADAAHAALVAALERQRAALVQRRDIARAQRDARAEQLQNHQQSLAEGLASAKETPLLRDAVQASDTTLAALGAQLAGLGVTRAERTVDHGQRELERSLALGRARAAVDEAVSLRARAALHSPVAGRVASVLAAPGAWVRPGEVIVQIAPSGAQRPER